MIAFFLGRDAAGEWLRIELWPSWFLITGQILLAASVVLSIYSGWRYARAHWAVVIRSGRS
jgi:hypothetical protein